MEDYVADDESKKEVPKKKGDVNLKLKVKKI